MHKQVCKNNKTSCLLQKKRIFVIQKDISIFYTADSNKKLNQSLIEGNPTNARESRSLRF